jgi:predicted lipoprotein with Yx(FWY)xxD motif
MTRRLLPPLLLLAVLSACATPQDARDAAPPAGDRTVSTTVATADGGLGTHLVDGEGRTLYLFTLDGPGVSNCDDDCLASWPPLLTDGAPAATGAADAALLDTLVRVDGTLQLTYAGWPLYRFAADTAAGDINGQGVNGVWFAVAPDGMMIAGEAADEGEDAMDDGMSPSGGSGYGY